ncbi:hypothetical protein Curi_c29260 [Gottschalkia acidurici 9a]|uniref:Uncharacterized protein n=1 Tax=Gottschalkia acidurici (strain ATCC 7906 / DSM 604 / BCRC 14475 / CIP 104303 / KCTC 5404 / NCIMB 10678 / 9a) TaxID=1128398 RepID=K0B459_GOTA9|nr:ParM/StbA family protein [Gottschalkia acidurici]AFS79892.1 hypothetical protein Curi_c29260 [Gottschalkia acidurici 9a]
MSIVKEVIGLDNGFSTIKTSRGVKVPAYMSQGSLGIEGANQIIFYDGKEMTIGYGGVGHFGSEDKTKDEKDRLILESTTLTALYLSFQDEIEQGAEELHLVLGTGLPASSFTEQKESFIKFLKDIDKRVKLGLNGRVVRIKVDDVHCSPQGSVTPVLDIEKFKAVPLAVLVDWGWNTVDVTIFVDGKPVKVKSIKMGVAKLYDSISSVLYGKLGMDVKDYQIEDYIKYIKRIGEYKIMFKGELHSVDYIKPIIENYLEQINGELRKLDEYERSEKVYLTGGGFEAFGEKYIDLINLKSGEVLENAQFTNANSFEKLAKMMELKAKKGL